MKIAIVSDLHIGLKARRFDLQVDGTPSPGVLAYLDEFKSFVARNGITADVLAVPGDVANHARPEEYALASLKVKEIAYLLNVDVKNILFVPGNHDVCWPVQKIGGDFWKSKKFLPMAEVFSPEIGDQFDSLFKPPFATVIELEGVLFVLLNSVFSDDYQDEDSPYIPHHGAFAPETAEFLKSRMPQLQSHKPGFTVLLTHHHILPQSDPDPYWKDFSMMNNSDSLLDLIAEAGIDLVIHGHKHWPRFRGYRDAPRPHFSVLCAGSFSAQIDEAINAKVFNKFHIVELDGRDPESNATGTVLSWSYHGGHGWKPSRQENGIAHRTPFGHYRAASAILDEVRAAADTLDWTGGAIDFEALASAIPFSEYLSDEQITTAVRTVAEEKGRKLLSDTGTSKRYLV
jgi:3',5'-cyclic AMP phosphodiesterase CpdA